MWLGGLTRGVGAREGAHDGQRRRSARATSVGDQDTGSGCRALSRRGFEKGESLVPGERLTRDYERAHDEHQRAVAALIPLLVRMALESVAEVLPGTQRLEVCGEVNEDWVPILRIQRVLGAEATVLFDVAVGHDERAVEDVIDDVNSEYLDVLLDLSGDDFMGAQTIDTATAEP